MSSWLSIYILAPVLGWFFAHLAKLILQLYKTRGAKLDVGIFFRAGGMPSSHSSVIVATVVVIGAREGVDSAIFGLCVAVASIIIYDALNVRRSVGEIGNALKSLKPKGDSGFFVAYGHTPVEVVGGVLVGATVAVLLLQIL